MIKKDKTNPKVKMVFYINLKDKELIKNHCELLQIKPSFFIRNIVLEKLGRPIFEPKKMKIETKQYNSQLNKIGVNLNQIAKKLNSGLQFQVGDQIEVLKSIELLNEHILEIKSQL
ncbi:plasmid mobilization relaxosome protein MobC [Polaribacter haliotis]|uniref:Plasmid mobilization relaxosome protein MobC n=2 Tax=Polaribacter TaxID=52959 RepID=A0A7L8AG90_9FLAO|nr:MULTISPECIES: plasmid mobilization relaxosome protein MobC [Polaribacter]MDD7914092.1 plasmid mobilization relaxosome protein MobC [Polaribacter sp. MSW5]QOD61028.1 plasmid mobilization relaxosome protein MobC [Polaribacter haliotis]